MPGRRILGPAGQPPNVPAGTVSESPVLTLYQRAGCHLCEDMQAILYELVDPDSFVLEQVDIDTDPVLRARFDRDVPVLMHRDQELCRHFLDLEAVQRVLAGYNTAI